MNYEWYAKIDKVTFRVLNDIFFFLINRVLMFLGSIKKKKKIILALPFSSININVNASLNLIN